MLRFTLRVLAFGTLTLAVPGCDSLTGCEEERETVEVVSGDIGEGFARLRLGFLREDGYDCSDTEPVRNAFGTRIGTRYNCTRCK